MASVAPIVKLPPPHAERFFGQSPQPMANGFAWGGVPWNNALSLPDNYAGLLGRLQRFPHPQNPANSAAIAGMTDLDCDTDGPGGSRKVDPWWRPETSLRYRDGASCDSRKFPGIVIPPPLNKYGLRVGDFGYACYHGLYMSVQVYDYGPDNKIGEAAERVGRGLEIIAATVSSHGAAMGDYPPVKDFFILLFPGTAPVNPDPNRRRWCAATQVEIELHAREAFEKFTGRA